MILVTGANGFVGSAVLHYLQQEGRSFRAASRKPLAGFHSVGEINAETDWSAALDKIETVIHCAARVHITASEPENALDLYRQTNREGAANLARQAAKRGVRRFVFISSVKVNGERTLPGKPFRASDTPHPEDAYGQSKLEAEHALLAIGAETGMEIVILRPPLVYGPGVRANFRSLMRLVQMGLPLPFAGIQNRRSMVYVGNLAYAIVRLIDAPLTGNSILMAGDGSNFSTPGLMRALANAMGIKQQLFSLPQSVLQLPFWLLGRNGQFQRLSESLEIDSTPLLQLVGGRFPVEPEQALKMTAEDYLKAPKG